MASFMTLWSYFELVAMCLTPTTCSWVGLIEISLTSSTYNDQATSSIGASIHSSRSSFSYVSRYDIQTA